MSLLFSALYWSLFVVITVVLFLGALGIWLLTLAFDPDRRLLHRYTCWWSQLYLVCLPGCRIRVEGRQKILPNTAYVFVANHQSVTDTMVLAALAVPFKWVSKKEVLRIPCIGWNLLLNRHVIVDRGNIRSVPQTMAICRHWLERGIPLMMFPEGHRSPTGELLKFHGGAFKLAAEAGCAVVPIVVNGTHGIYRGLRVKPFPGTITIQILDPLTVADAGGRPDKLRDLVHEQMTQTLAQARGQKRPRLTAGAG
jgi:1-acyl-sn-glycerol-3-phosphate acyltransferase